MDQTIALILAVVAQELSDFGQPKAAARLRDVLYGCRAGAGKWLEDYLKANGPTLRRDVLAAAEAVGYKPQTVDKAYHRSRRVCGRRGGRYGQATWWIE